MLLEIIVVIFVAAFLLILLLFFFPESHYKNSDKSDVVGLRKTKGSLLVCPICGHRTSTSERVYAKSMVLPDGRKRVEVEGCDICRDKIKNCPRCRHELSIGEIVFALLLPAEKQLRDGSSKPKERLHIEGCMYCYRR